MCIYICHFIILLIIITSFSHSRACMDTGFTNQHFFTPQPSPTPTKNKNKKWNPIFQLSQLMGIR